MKSSKWTVITSKTKPPASYTVGQLQDTTSLVQIALVWDASPTPRSYPQIPYMHKALCTHHTTV